MNMVKGMPSRFNRAVSFYTNPVFTGTNTSEAAATGWTGSSPNLTTQMPLLDIERKRRAITLPVTRMYPAPRA